tara:strand:+ start:56 stop:166 length:111 start_codon:yes stop_codon:yes gene_type:complete
MGIIYNYNMSTHVFYLGEQESKGIKSSGFKQKIKLS